MLNDCLRLVGSLISEMLKDIGTGIASNRSRVDALAREVRSYGIYEGGPKFLMGKRKINDEEYEEQQTRLKWGLTPDREQDFNSRIDNAQSADELIALIQSQK